MTRPQCAAWIFITALACARPGSSADSSGGRDASVEYRGKLVLAGSEPATAVQLVTDGGSIELAGNLKPELRRLAGAVVIARGSWSGGRGDRRLDVSDYEIAEIDGQVPTIGVLERRDGRLWLAGRDTLELPGAPDELLANDGAKVWIIGRRSERSLRVQSYGVIRAAARP